MKENYTVCNCKKVSFNDIANALDKMGKIEDVVSAFDDVQKITNCTTGCGGCYKKVLQVISDVMYGYDSKLSEGCND